MRTIKIALLATVAGAALTTATLAADPIVVMDPTPIVDNYVGFDWEGVYAGLYVAGQSEPATFGIGGETLDQLVVAADNEMYRVKSNHRVARLIPDTEPLINVEHALHVLEIIEATRESQKTGKRIEMKTKFKWPVV